jgi:hypothetical protein
MRFGPDLKKVERKKEKMDLEKKKMMMKERRREKAMLNAKEKWLNMKRGEWTMAFELELEKVKWPKMIAQRQENQKKK